jgi:hypothetical protein
LRRVLLGLILAVALPPEWSLQAVFLEGGAETGAASAVDLLLSQRQGDEARLLLGQLALLLSVLHGATMGESRSFEGGDCSFFGLSPDTCARVETDGLQALRRR